MEMSSSIFPPPNGAPPQLEIEIFLKSLRHGNKSPSKRAYAAWFIATYPDEIEAYIQEKVKILQNRPEAIAWSQRARKRVAAHRSGPKGYVYDPRSGRCRHSRNASFHLVQNQATLTFTGLHGKLRYLGYALMAMLLGALFWWAHTFAKAIDQSQEEWGRFFEGIL
jgi:hypothetical protein